MRRRGFLKAAAAALCGVPAVVLGAKSCACGEWIPDNIECTIDSVPVGSLCAPYVQLIEEGESHSTKLIEVVVTEDGGREYFIWMTPRCAYRFSYVACISDGHGYDMCQWGGDGKVWAARSGDRSGGQIIMQECQEVG